MSERHNVLLKCKRLMSDGASEEVILEALRTGGCTKGESIKVLVDFGYATFGAAKKMVHMSETWKDVRSRDEEFHDDLINKLQQ